MRPLTDRELLDLQYKQDHCPHCDRAYETRLQICPDDDCAMVHSQ